MPTFYVNKQGIQVVIYIDWAKPHWRTPEKPPQWSPWDSERSSKSDIIIIIFFFFKTHWEREEHNIFLSFIEERRRDFGTWWNWCQLWRKLLPFEIIPLRLRLNYGNMGLGGIWPEVWEREEIETEKKWARGKKLWVCVIEETFGHPKRLEV